MSTTRAAGKTAVADEHGIEIGGHGEPDMTKACAARGRILRPSGGLSNRRGGGREVAPSGVSDRLVERRAQAHVCSTKDPARASDIAESAPFKADETEALVPEIVPEADHGASAMLRELDDRAMDDAIAAYTALCAHRASR